MHMTTITALTERALLRTVVSVCGACLLTALVLTGSAYVVSTWS